MNAIEQYFAESKDTPSALANRMKKPASTIWRLVKGKRSASARLAREIELGTGGKLTASDVLAACAQRDLDNTPVPNNA